MGDPARNNWPAVTGPSQSGDRPRQGSPIPPESAEPPARRSALIVQAVTQSFIVTHVPQGRTSALGLYAMIYYIGGSMGAWLPSFVWDRGGWPATVAIMAALLTAVGLVIWFTWDRARVRT